MSVNCLNPIRSGFFSRGCSGGGDSAHHFETPVRASFSILPSFETIPLMTHERRPRIQKMKCLAQKLTKWRRIEKLWQKRENEIFSKIERFALCKSCYRPSTKSLSFRPGWSDFAETGLYGFVITNGEKSRSAKAPNSAEFEELWNFRAMGRIYPGSNRAKVLDFWTFCPISGY